MSNTNSSDAIHSRFPWIFLQCWLNWSRLSKICWQSSHIKSFTSECLTIWILSLSFPEKLFSQIVQANLFSEWNALMCFLMLGCSLKVFSQWGQVKIPFLYVHKCDLWGFKLVQILVSISHICELALTVSLNSHLITKWGIHVLLHARQDLTMCHTDIHHEFLQVSGTIHI